MSEIESEFLSRSAYSLDVQDWAKNMEKMTYYSEMNVNMGK